MAQVVIVQLTNDSYNGWLTPSAVAGPLASHMFVLF